MSEIENTKEIGKELTRIFDRFNHHFYNDELPEVIITFKPTKGAHGHMTTAPVWISETSDDKYELYPLILRMFSPLSSILRALIT